MSAFEFAFALFGLLLGLCIAEVFGGLGRSFEARKRCSVGWLTPLLGAFVLIDLLWVWFGLWESRAHIPMNPLVLIAGAHCPESASRGSTIVCEVIGLARTGRLSTRLALLILPLILFPAPLEGAEA